MNRLFVVILLLTSLVVIITPTQIVATESMQLQDFDREGCYSNCPCGIQGMEQVCADCKQKWDDEFWKDFDASFGEK